MSKAKDSFFSTLGLSRGETLSLLIYALLSAILLYVFLESGIPVRRNLLIGYALGSQFLFYFLGYASLRKASVFGIAIGIALVHLYGWYHWHIDPSLLTRRGHAATGLRNTLPLLILFLVLRWISRKWQGQDLVAPSRGTSTDIIEGRPLTVVDYLFAVLYFVAMIVLM